MFWCEKSVGIPGKLWWTGPILLYLGFYLPPFSDLGIIPWTGTFIQQALLSSRHWTKAFTSHFSRVAHRSTAPASPGSSLERQQLWLHPDLHCNKLSMCVNTLQPEKLCFHVLLLTPHPRPTCLEVKSMCRVTKLVWGGTALFTQTWPCSIHSYSLHLLKPYPLSVQLRYYTSLKSSLMAPVASSLSSLNI